MLRIENTISKNVLYSLSCRDCFFAFWLKLGVGMCSVMPQDANGKRIKAWKILQLWNQIWVFIQNFQCSKACLGAAYEVLGLGFDLVMIMEWNWLVIWPRFKLMNEQVLGFLPLTKFPSFKPRPRPSMQFNPSLISWVGPWYMEVVQTQMTLFHWFLNFIWIFLRFKMK